MELFVRGKLQHFIVMALLVFVVSFVPGRTSAQDSTSASGPQLSITESVFNFGDVKESDVLEHAFKIMNKGDQPVEIKDVKPT